VTDPTEPIIRFDRVDVVFNTPSGGSVRALDSVALDVAPRKFTTVVGPSGCGKTTLLRLASGLVAPAGGRTLYKGKPVHGLNSQIGFVTQESNLFPWLTLVENVEFPLAVRGVRPKERRDRARDWIKRVGLEGFESHYPFQLSGGMQKRASIVRTLIYDPEVVLMDEPFGPLDAQTRMQMQHDLLELWQRDQKTILFITHDLVEAIALSDTVVIMSRRPGRVLDIFEVPLPRPRNVFEIYVAPGFDKAYAYLWDHFRTELGR
jgi:NitT/TauT family transport system ATP-binding protein